MSKWRLYYTLKDKLNFSILETALKVFIMNKIHSQEIEALFMQITLRGTTTEKNVLHLRELNLQKKLRFFANWRLFRLTYRITWAILPVLTSVL